MARRPVPPVNAVDRVTPVRPVSQGSIYFRHLDEWRNYSRMMGEERRARLRQAELQRDAPRFVLPDAGADPDSKDSKDDEQGGK